MENAMSQRPSAIPAPNETLDLPDPAPAQPELSRQELTLDPEDWSEMRRSAHRALDAVLDYQMHIRRRPTWQPVPKTAEDLLTTPAPEKGSETDAVIDDMLQHVMPFPAGHAHPRFWGWVCGTGTPIGMISDMLAAGINASSGTFNDAPSRVEAQVLHWMQDLFRFPESTSGIVTSGGSVANMIGLVVGRDAILGDSVRKQGLAASDRQPVIYASKQVHSSIDKAMQMLGLGLDNLRKVAVDDHYRMDVEALEQQIEKDRADGLAPCAIIASAGTVNTGAIDDLEAIAAIAKRHGVWFHVDGAIGALAVMSPNLRPRFKGIELADSLAFDFHKWLYVPYEAGCVLIRNGDLHRQSFRVAASYLEPPPRGLGAMADSSNIRGPQLSRGFKALKIWAQIREHGLEKLGNLHDQNVAQIQYLAELIDREPQLERMAPSSLNILCYRYIPTSIPEARWDDLNTEILMRLQEQGIAVPSSTRLDGKFALRVANTNQRSRREDFELLVRESLRLGREIEAEA